MTTTTNAKRISRFFSLKWTVPLGLVVVIAVWTALSPSFYFPPVTSVLASFREEWLFQRVVSDLLPSLYRVFGGYAIGSVVGIVFGVLLGLVPVLSEATRPLVEFLRSIPPAILIPIGIVIFGLGDGMKIVIIAVATVFPVLLNTIDGVKSVDPTTLDMARAYGIPFRGRLARVIFPSTLPRILTGMRVSLAIAIVVMVVAEMIGSTNGVGYFVLQQERSFMIPGMWSGVLLIGLLGFLTNLLFVMFEKRILFWYYRTSRGGSR